MGASLSAEVVSQRQSRRDESGRSRGRPPAHVFQCVAEGAEVTVFDFEPGWCVGSDPCAVLTPSERRQLESYPVAARRHSYLAGRWAAKEAVRARFPTLAQNEIEVFNSSRSESRGKPLVRVLNGSFLGSLSISHRLPLAAAAFSPSPPIGLDLEAVELRTLGFRLTAFTRGENAWIGAAPEGDQPLLETLLWSAKEAMSKVLGTGLSVPLESLRCDLGGLSAATVREHVGAPGSLLRLDGTVLTASPPLPCTLTARGLVQRGQSYVLCVASGRPGATGCTAPTAPPSPHHGPQ